MTTPADFTTRARTEMFAIYQAYQALARRVDDLSNEVDALGGAATIYADGFPAQADGFTINDMGAAFSNLTALVGAPSDAQKQTIIRARRS